MKLNKKELIIQQKMRDFEPELDTNALWDSLAEHVPQKKKRIGWFYMILLGLLTLIGIVGLVVYTSNSGELKNSKQLVEVNSKSKIINKNSNNKELNLTGINGETTQQSLVNTNNSLNNSTSIHISNKKVNKVNKVSKIKKNKTIKTEQPVIKQYANILNKEKIVQDHIVKSNKNITNSNTILITPILSIIPKLLPIVQINNGVPTPAITSNPKTVSAYYFTWNIGTSLGYFDHEFVPNNKESEVYSSLILGKSKPVLGVNLGVSYHFSGRYYINSGIQYTQLVTKIHPKWNLTQSEENQTTNGLTQRVTRQFDYEAIGHNYQNVLDIPFNLGIKLYNSNKLNLSVEGGALINVFTYSKGVFMDEKYKLQYYTNSKNNPYNRFNVGWQTSIVVDYNLKNNMNIYFQPKLSFRSIKYKISNLNIKEKYRIYNLKVGLRYSL